MNVHDIEDAVIFCAKEIAQEIYVTEKLQKAGANEAWAKKAAYDSILEFIYGGDQE